MNKILLTYILISATILLSCNKDNREVEFEMDYQTSFTLNSTIGINLPFSPPSPDINTNSTNEFSLKNTNSSLVKEVTLKTLTLTITNPTDKTFSFVKSVHIFISAPGVKEIEAIAYDNIPSNIGNTLVFSTENDTINAVNDPRNQKITLYLRFVNDQINKNSMKANTT